MSGKLVKSEGLQSFAEWQTFCRRGLKPANIPAGPSQMFGKEFQGVGNWLGTNYVATFNRQYRSFTASKQYVREHRISSIKQWSQHCSSGEKPDDIPTDVAVIYSKEWTTWGDFLGTGFVCYQNRKHKSFEESRKFVRKLGLKTRAEWERYCKSGKKPDDIPAGPSMVYSEWTYWDDWLGTGNSKHKKKPPLKCKVCGKVVVDRAKSPSALGMCGACYHKHRRKLKPHICSECGEKCFIEGRNRCKKCYRRFQRNNHA